MQIPILVGTEKVPVRPAQKRAEDDQQHPENQKPRKERRDRERPLLERVVSVASGILVDIGDSDQPNDDQPRKHHAGQPRVEVDQHLLQTKEVPWGFGGVRRDVGISRLLQGGSQNNRPNRQERRAQDQRNQLDVHQVGPDQNLVVRARLRQRSARLDILIVDGRLTKRKPDHERNREHHHHDRNVVRLRDDLGEVLVHATGQESQQAQRRQRPRHRRPGQRPVEPKEDHQPQYAQDHKPMGLANRVNEFLNAFDHRSGGKKMRHRSFLRNSKTVVSEPVP